MDTESQLDADRRRMIDDHLKRRGIHSPQVLAAMARGPRERFVSPDVQRAAYTDRALAIDCQQTISQPYMVALMSQALSLSGTEHVLEIGTGSGYQTAILTQLAGDVVSIERHEALSRSAGRILAQLNYHNVQLVVGDGTQGHPQAAPYDRILVTAAAPECPPALWQQLREGGMLVIPIGPDDSQTLHVIHKIGGQPHPQHLVACRFVPLISDKDNPSDIPDR